MHCKSEFQGTRNHRSDKCPSRHLPRPLASKAPSWEELESQPRCVSMVSKELPLWTDPHHPASQFYIRPRLLVPTCGGFQREVSLGTPPTPLL